MEQIKIDTVQHRVEQRIVLLAKNGCAARQIFQRDPACRSNKPLATGVLGWLSLDAQADAGKIV